MNYLNEKLYEQSNNVTEVKFGRLRKDVYKQLLMCGEDRRVRENIAQSLVDYLCGKIGIPHVRVRVKAIPQLGTPGRSKTYGQYHPHQHLIDIYNLTQTRKKAVSIKSFADTLLHEFMHHYDFEYLGFDASPHTKGFYMRIDDLRRKLYSIE